MRMGPEDQIKLELKQIPAAVFYKSLDGLNVSQLTVVDDFHLDLDAWLCFSINTFLYSAWFFHNSAAFTLRGLSLLGSETIFKAPHLTIWVQPNFHLNYMGLSVPL